MNIDLPVTCPFCEKKFHVKPPMHVESALLVRESERKFIDDERQQSIRIFDSMTRREREMCAHLLTGAKNRQIARELGTSEQVVKNYMRVLFDKTGMSTRLELAVFIANRPTLNLFLDHYVANGKQSANKAAKNNTKQGVEHGGVPSE